MKQYVNVKGILDVKKIIAGIRAHVLMRIMDI